MTNKSKYLVGYSLIGFVILLAALTYKMDISASLVGICCAILPVPIYLYLVLRRDVEPEPKSLLLFGFTWGAIPALVGSLIANTILASICTLSEEVLAIVTTPIIEEFFKGLGVLILFLFFRKHWDGIRDAIVYASMVGLGFAMSENILYYMSGWLEGGLDTLLPVLISRGGSTFYAHTVFVALTAVGLQVARKMKQPLLNVVGFGGFFLAILLHMLWNGVSIVEHGRYYTLLWFVYYIPATLFIAYYRDAKDKEK